MNIFGVHKQHLVFYLITYLSRIKHFEANDDLWKVENQRTSMLSIKVKLNKGEDYLMKPNPNMMKEYIPMKELLPKIPKRINFFN